jgi:hypothetical protein
MKQDIIDLLKENYITEVKSQINSYSFSPMITYKIFDQTFNIQFNNENLRYIKTIGIDVEAYLVKQMIEEAKQNILYQRCKKLEKIKKNIFKNKQQNIN